MAFGLLGLLYISFVCLCSSVKVNTSHIGVLAARIDGTSHIDATIEDANHSATVFEGRRTVVSATASRAHNRKHSDTYDNSTIGIDVRIPTEIKYGIFIAVVICFGLTAMMQRPSEPEVVSEVKRTEAMALTFVRKSGETITTVNAYPHWTGKSLRNAVSAELPPQEYLHSILFVSNAVERILTDHGRIDSVGIKDGMEMRVVLVPSMAIASGIALLSYSKMMSGPIGAHSTARLWLHEDRSANLVCGEYIDVGMTEAKYLDGTFDDKGRLQLQDDTGQDIEGSIEESHGQQRLTMQVPILGDIELRQELADAVFDVSQTSICFGWISVFECGEMVVKVAKKTPEGAPREDVHLRLQLSKLALPDGSAKLEFYRQSDFERWQDSAASEVRCSIPYARLCGPLGRRKIIFKDFPVLGSAELIEHPFCGDMMDM